MQLYDLRRPENGGDLTLKATGAEIGAVAQGR
jgi:hypothetical protein